MIQFMPNFWLIMFIINLIFFFINYLNLYFYKKMKL